MDKYLRLYAEPEIAALDGLSGQGKWQNVMVIPACNESPAFLRAPPPCDGRSLLILVINESETASAAVSTSNRKLASAVFERFELQWQSDPKLTGFALSLFFDPLAARDVLLVDRFRDGRKLPEKSGVGLARKIGVDLAGKLVHNGLIRSPWVHCTDADVQLPETYFRASDKVQKSADRTAVLIYPFHHCDEPAKAESQDVILATQLYELSLRYYVAGMKFAGSGYAFHTIGSTMAVNAIHYAKVRGFPKREAGEDFYLLNKLAKVGQVLELAEGPDCESIEIEARRSDRVPFGTGAAVNKITGLADPLADFRFYDPVVFELLGCWLQAMPVIWQTPSRELASCVFPHASGVVELDDKQQSLLQGLLDMGVARALEHAFRQSKNLAQFSRQMSTWFDAFRTLKLIHLLRERCAGSIGYNRLERHPTFLHLLAVDPDLSSYYGQLSRKYLQGTTTADGGESKITRF
jgi:hypothetical protein